MLFAPSKARSRSLVAGAAVAILATAAHSQTQPGNPASGNDASRAAERIQREQQELQRQQLEQQRRKLPAPGAVTAAPEAEVTGDGDAGPCRDISEIAINSAPNLQAADRTRITNAYVGRCLHVRDIEQLMADVTNAYIERGYATTRVYLPQQDLSKGKLTLAVAEGVVEKITLAGTGSNRISVGGAMPGVEGEPLNLRDLEQGLDQINRLQSNHATFDVVPGETAGSSRIVVRNQADRAFHFGATVDTLGQDSTGENQTGLNTALDSPFGLNDYVSLMYRQSLPAHTGDRYSKLGSFSYLIPYGYSTTSLAYSRSDYKSFLTAASGAKIVTAGDSKIASARFEEVVHRSRSSRMTLAAGLSTKSSRNYLADQLLAVNSRNLTALDLSLNYTTGLLGGLVSLEGGYSRGLSVMGALEDPDGLTSDAPRAQFRRYNYSANYSLPFRAVGLNASFSSSFNGQYARTPLFGSEQMYVGGIYSVRGFENTSLAGDHGFVWRNELSMRETVNAGGTTRFTLRPYLGLDYGRTRMLNDSTGAPEGSPAGATAGLVLSTQTVALEVTNSRPVHVPSYMTREGSQTYFRFNLSF